jgi:hypothetical protein
MSSLLSVETWSLISTATFVAMVALGIRFAWRRGKKIGDL